MPASPATPAATPATTTTVAEQTLCPVTGEAIDKSIFIDYQGRRVYFCCPMCEDKFKADPAKYLAILDGQQPYPTGGMAGMTGSTPAAPAAAHDHSAHSHGTAAPTSSAAVKYTCPMDPEIVTDAPGRCPKCGMNLVPKQ